MNQQTDLHGPRTSVSVRRTPRTEGGVRHSARTLSCLAPKSARSQHLDLRGLTGTASHLGHTAPVRHMTIPQSCSRMELRTRSPTELHPRPSKGETTSLVVRAAILLTNGAATPLVHGAATSLVVRAASPCSVGATTSLADGATCTTHCRSCTFARQRTDGLTRPPQGSDATILLTDGTDTPLVHGAASWRAPPPPGVGHRLLACAAPSPMHCPDTACCASRPPPALCSLHLRSSRPCIGG